MKRRKYIVPTVVMAAALIAAVMFRDELTLWFSAVHAGEDGAHQHDHSAADGVAHYTCSMHPSVQQNEPGICPLCSMALTPVTTEEQRSGTVTVDEVRRQRIGLRTAAAERRQVSLNIRAVGDVRYDESRLTDVNLRMSGWVQRLIVDETGQQVRRGQTMFTLYSPELYAAQLEHLLAVRRQAGASGGVLSSLARSSRQRLRLLGLTAVQVRALENRGDALENVPIAAPASGYIIDKNIVEGGRVEAGTRVYQIADLSQVWIDADIYESDLPHIVVGQPVDVSLPYTPDQQFEGRIDYIYPALQGSSRTGRARVVLANPDLALRPDMYANLQIHVDLGERLVVPDSAVIYTGPRRLVFVDHGEGSLRPQEVTLGVHVDGLYEVTEGLDAGDSVVTSGGFLIAAESRIRSAADYWRSADDTD